MRILPVNTSQTTRPNFQSCFRTYSPKSIRNSDCFGKEIIRNSTNLFREDLDWRELVNFMKQHFANKEKVNIYSLACSDGSEAYSLVISLLEILPEKLQHKFLPIEASDIDPVILNAVDTKRINLYAIEFYKPENKFNFNISKYFTNPEASIMIKGDDISESDTIFSYRLDKKLIDAVKFKKSDIVSELKNINDDGNSVVMCRNVFPYLNEKYTDDIVSNARKQLKKGSLFIIGDYDNITNINNKLLENGFKQELLNKSFITDTNVFLKT